jgi:hypothetical protein
MSRFERRLKRRGSHAPARGQSLAERTRALFGGEIKTRSSARIPEMAGLPSLADQLTDFVGAFFNLDEMSLPAVENTLALALVCWNAGTPSPDQERREAEGRALIENHYRTTLGAEFSEETYQGMRHFTDQLIELRKTQFAGDPRLMLDFEVFPTGKNSYRLNVSGMMPALA